MRQLDFDEPSGATDVRPLEFDEPAKPDIGLPSDTASIPVSTQLNPQTDEKISTQQEEPISMVVANRIKDFFGYNDTTNKRFQTSYEISQTFGISLEQAQDDRVYRNLVSDTFSTAKPLDKVSSELMSVSFMAAAGVGLVTAPIPTLKALAYFGVANEVVSLALSSTWDGLTPSLEDYDFSETRTLVDDVPKNSPPWLYAVAEATDFLAKAGMVGGAMKAEAGFKGKIKKGVEDIFAKYKKPLALAEPKVAPKELPLGTQEVGLPKDTTKIPVSTKLQPEKVSDKQTWEMTREEIYSEREFLTSSDKNLEQSILGRDYDAWIKAQRQLNSRKTNVVDNAYNTIDAIEEKLTKKNKDRLYGIDEAGKSAEELSEVLQQVDAIDDSSPEKLGESIKYAITKISPKADKSNLSIEESNALTVISTAMRIAKEKGWDTRAISDAAIRASADRFSDPQDALFMLHDYMEPTQKTSQSVISTQEPKLPVVPKDGMPSKALAPKAQQQLIGTPLEGAKSSVEVRAKIASDLGVQPQKLVVGGVGGFAKWQSDGHLVDTNPIVKWGVENLARENIEADERHLRQIKIINAVAKKARRGGGKRLSMEEDPTGVSTWQKDVRTGKTGGLWDRLVPTDPLVKEFLESPNKAEVAKRMTKEELDYALVLHDGWEIMFQRAYEAEKINSKLDNYVTHIRRNFIEAWKTTGDFGLAFKESRDNFLHDMAKFRVRDPKTGKRLPFEKSFRYAQERKGGIQPTENMAKAYLTYNETFEKMMAYNNVMPAIVEGLKSIKPAEPTPMEQRSYEMLEKFIDQWGKNKKGIPAEWSIDPQGEFAFYLKSARMFVSIMDLGLNPIIGTAAAVGEGSMNYIALGPKRVALGVERGLTPEGKAILKKYESWIGRSPWSELADASHQITDGFMKSMFGFFQVSAVEANKVGLLGQMSKKEFKTGIVSSENLAKYRLLLNRHRYQKGMESVAENTVEGKFFGQYRFSWGLPPLATLIKNVTAGGKRVFTGEKMTDQQVFELRRLGELMFFATLLAKGYYPDEDDQSLSAKTRRKIARESFTTLGAAQMLLSPGSSRVSGLNLNIVMGTYETLKGTLTNSPELIEKGLKKLKGVVVPGFMKIGAELLTPEKIEPPSRKKRGPEISDDISALEIIEDTAPQRR
jgi:hypothetical protein